MRTGTSIPFLLAAAALYFSFLGSMPLLDPDEGRYAEISREMAASGDYVTPRLNGVAYLEKPPLLYWGNALSMSILGEDELGARAFGALCTVSLAAVTLWIGSTLAGPAAGLVSASFLAASPFVFAIGRLNTVDNPLAPAVAFSVFAVWLYMSGRSEQRLLLWAGYVAAALAFLSKGLIGIVFPGAILVLWAILSGRPRTILRAVSPVGIALFLAVSLPWLLLCRRANPDFLWFFFVQEHFLRFSTEAHNRGNPYWYFLPFLAGGILPWLPFLAGRTGEGAPGGGGSPRERLVARCGGEGILLLWCWLLFVLLFFTASKSKLPTYVLPLFPPLCVLLGRRALRLAEGGAGGKEEGWRERLPGFLCALVALLLAAALLLAPGFGRAPQDPAEWRSAVLFPLAALAAYAVLPIMARRAGRTAPLAASVLSFALFLVALGGPVERLVGYRSSRAPAAAIAREMAPGDAVAVVSEFRPGLAFYLKRQVIFSGDPGELAYGIERDPRRSEWYLPRAELEALWRSERRLFVLLSGRNPGVALHRFPRGRLIWSARKGILVVNR